MATFAISDQSLPNKNWAMSFKMYIKVSLHYSIASIPLPQDDRLCVGRISPYGRRGSVHGRQRPVSRRSHRPGRRRRRDHQSIASTKDGEVEAEERQEVSQEREEEGEEEKGTRCCDEQTPAGTAAGDGREEGRKNGEFFTECFHLSFRSAILAEGFVHYTIMLLYKESCIEYADFAGHDFSKGSCHAELFHAVVTSNPISSMSSVDLQGMLS